MNIINLVFAALTTVTLAVSVDSEKIATDIKYTPVAATETTETGGFYVNPSEYGVCRQSIVEYSDSWYDWLAYGTLDIPVVGISVPLYCGTTTDGLQNVVDAKNSAGIYCGWWSPVDVLEIGDHNTQSFAPLKNVKNGDIATITLLDGRTQKYVVYAIEPKAAVNNGDGFLLPDGSMICDTYYVHDMIILHTCNKGDSKTNTVVCLAPV